MVNNFKVGQMYKDTEEGILQITDIYEELIYYKIIKKGAYVLELENCNFDYDSPFGKRLKLLFLNNKITNILYGANK